MKQSFEELHEFMKDLPAHNFDNDSVLENLDLMLQDLGKQKLTTIPASSSDSFTPKTAPPEYPVPPEGFRSFSIRRKPNHSTGS